LVEAQCDVTSNIFTEHHARSALLNNSAHFRPEVTVIIRAFSLPGVAERLARVSAGNKVNSSIVVWFQSLYVVVYWHTWEVLLQHPYGIGIDLTECRRLDSAHHLSRKREPADATEQI
jgi:hypothetical protein